MTDGGNFLLQIVKYPRMFLKARRDRDGWAEPDFEGGDGIGYKFEQRSVSYVIPRNQLKFGFAH